MKAIRLLLVVPAAVSLVIASVGVAAASGRQGDFRFYGAVQSVLAGTNGIWVVDGRSAQVTPATRIDRRYGLLGVGSFVEVKGWLQADGSVNAIRIDVER